jgi:glutathione S-transferase
MLHQVRVVLIAFVSLAQVFQPAFSFFPARLNKMTALSPSWSAYVDAAPSWDVLDGLVRGSEKHEERQDFEDEVRGYGPANHRASVRLFDSPAGFEPEVILYRDSAGWCPYCEKVWLQLEEKRIPYKVEKVACYA